MDGIDELWEAYVEGLDSPSWAISRELGRYLIKVVGKERPHTVLDLGAGFSSLLFRLLEVPVIVTVDPNEAWLERTRSLWGNPFDKKEYGAWLLESQFAPGILFDLVFVDIGELADRPRWITQMDKYANRIIIVDDADRPSIADACFAFEDARKDWYIQFPVPETIDNQGRFAARLEKR